VSVGARDDPYLSYRFVVQIDALFVGGFSEVGGLEWQMEPETYEEGGVNDHVRKLPARYDHPNLVLQRGMTDLATLSRWTQRTADGAVTRMNGVILLLDETGGIGWGWAFLDAFPVRWSGPDLSADSNSVAVETLELAHEGLRPVPGLPPSLGTALQDLGGLLG
jgi:phage tail-like protein